MCLIVSSAKWRPYCLGLNVLTKNIGERNNTLYATVSFSLSIRHNDNNYLHKWHVSPRQHSSSPLCNICSLSAQRLLSAETPNAEAAWSVTIKYTVSKIIANSYLAKSGLHITYLSVAQSFCNFAHSTTVPLPCFVQNFKRIGNFKINYRQTSFHEIWVKGQFWR